MGEENWRIEQNAVDYLGQQRKKGDVADRRPVIRRASDILGPGIDYAAVRITDFGGTSPGSAPSTAVLALLNGYYSAAAGALNAPTTTEAFIGTTSGDATLGGIQSFTGMVSGNKYERVFTRNPADPDSVTFPGGWRKTFWGNDTDWVTAILGNGWLHFDARTVQFKRQQGRGYMRGIMKSGTVGAAAFTLPPGYRPEARTPYDYNMPVVANSAAGVASINGADGVVYTIAGNNAYFDMSSMSWDLAS